MNEKQMDGISITQIKVRMSKFSEFNFEFSPHLNNLMGLNKKYFFANLPTSRPYMDTNPINIIGSLYCQAPRSSYNNNNNLN